MQGDTAEVLWRKKEQQIKSEHLNMEGYRSGHNGADSKPKAICGNLNSENVDMTH